MYKVAKCFSALCWKRDTAESNGSLLHCCQTNIEAKEKTEFG